MAMGNKLFALAEREFKANRAAPVHTKFRGMKLNIGKFDESWDHKRGAAVRMMGVILRDDDKALYERVCASEESARTYTGAADWLQREANLLRRTAGMLDTAASRLGAVLERYEAGKIPAAS
jgi:hypothetical protein